MDVSQCWTEVEMFPVRQSMAFKSSQVNNKIHEKIVLCESFNERYIKKGIFLIVFYFFKKVNVLWQRPVYINTEWGKIILIIIKNNHSDVLEPMLQMKFSYCIINKQDGT